MTTTTETLMPEEFAELEPFARVWVLPTTDERCNKRLESSMQEMQAFYDATLPRGDEMFAYIDQFDFDDLPEKAVNVLWLLCSLAVVGFAVDVFKQPKIPDSGDAVLPFIVEPAP
jgi:hypothetical protein